MDGGGLAPGGLGGARPRCQGASRDAGGQDAHGIRGGLARHA